MQKTLKALANNTAATNVRFWGKVVGTERDYFIAEGVAEDANPPEEEENAELKEARGTGVNTFAYWVCNNPASDWVALPDLYPSDIKASRDIKMSFTGQLDRKLFSNPFFFKTEAVYLRAQIARICHSTTLVPRHVMRLQEDSTTEVEENQPEDQDLPIPVPSTQEMCSKSNWVHFTRNILKCSRITHLEPEVPENEEDVDPEMLMARVVAADPFEARLKSITDDFSVGGFKESWVLRKYGDFTNFNAANPLHKATNSGIVVVKSLIWPGSYNFFTQGKWMQVYLGDGLKFDCKNYFPVHAPKVWNDPEELFCMPEPNPTPERLAQIEEAERLAAEAEENE